MKTLGTILMSLCMFPMLWASQDCFQSGNVHYKEAAFAEAIRAYRKCVNAGQVSPDLHYNMGNAYGELDSIGMAIVSYKRALRLKPGMRDAKHNLDVMESRIVSRLPAIQPLFLISWLRSGANTLPLWVWTMLSGILVWSGLAAFYFFLYHEERKRRKQAFMAGIVLVGVLILTILFGTTRYQMKYDEKEAVVTVQRADLHAGPDGRSDVIVALHDGITVCILDQIGDWRKVRLPDGDQGWLAGAHITPIFTGL